MTMSSCGEKSVSYRLNATRLPAATHPTTVASKHRAVSAYRHNTGRHPMWSLPGTSCSFSVPSQHRPPPDVEFTRHDAGSGSTPTVEK